jgi:glycosyltransferase involved in cell wall biosynthesis
MRVVLATSALERGGVWRHICDLSSGLRDLGVDVVVAVAREASVLRDDASHRAFDVVFLDGAARMQADVVHVHLHDTYCRSCALLVAATSLRRSSVVVTEHLPRTDASDPRLRPGRRTPGAYRAKTRFKQLELAAARRVIVLSRGSAAFLAERYRLAPRRMVLIPNGVAGRPSPPPLPCGDDPMCVLAAGSLIIQKGIDVLIRAAAYARRPWTVVVAGDGDHRARLEDDAQRLAPGRVVFTGRVADITPLLAASDLVCVPSRWEAFPYVALEAMAAGRGVIGSRVDGLADMVVDGLNGRLVEPDQPRALADALDAAATDAALRAEWGRDGYQRVRRLYSAERMAIGTLSVYQSAVSG